MKNILNKMTEYEKDSFIDAVEVTLDYSQSVSEEDYELYKELIEERKQKKVNKIDENIEFPETVNLRLLDILKKGRIENEEDAEIFINNSEYETFVHNVGDRRTKEIDLYELVGEEITNSPFNLGDKIYVEIYAKTNLVGEEYITIADFPQELRYYNGNDEELSNFAVQELKRLLVKIRKKDEIKLDDSIVSYVEEHQKLISGMNLEKIPIVINAYGGPGAGKSTACMDICSELKKRGYNAEYVQEYAKELVYDKNFEMLDGTHQFELLKEQTRRLDRLLQTTDFIVTDSPILLNPIYSKERNSKYEEYVKELDTHYNTFSFFIERDISRFQEEGRIHNFQESLQKDEEIKKFLKDYGVYYGKYKHDTIDKVIENSIMTFNKANDLFIEKTNNNFKLNQVSVRLNQETPLYSDKAIKNAEDAVKIVGQELMANLDREQICIINLNTKNNPINFSIASVGTLNNALAEPREMLKASILSNAGSVIMLHNHPSGNYYPSVEDYQVTERIIKSFDSVGIKVLDHVIIAGNNIDDYYSMREENVKMFEESPVLTGKLEFSDISEHLLHKINVFLVAEDLSYWINNTHSTISLTDKEAEIILNYMDGHGYNLGVENENLVRIDVEEETPTAEKYNINEAIYAVCDWNAELISETNENINNAASVEEVCKLREYMKALRADESVIDAMFKKTSLGKTLELGTEKQEEKKTEHKKEKAI